MDEIDENVDYEDLNLERTDTFSYSEVSKAVTNLITVDVNEILGKAGLTSDKILVELEEAPLQMERESLEQYARRCLNFILLNKINKSLAKRFSKNQNIEELKDESDPEKAEFEDEYTDAYNDGDVDKMKELSLKYSMVPIILEDEIFGFPMSQEQLAEYRKLIEAYQRKLNAQLDKNCKAAEIVEQAVPEQQVEETEVPGTPKQQTEETKVPEHSEVPEEQEVAEQEDIVEEQEFFETDTHTTEEVIEETEFASIPSRKRYMDKTDFENEEQAFRWELNPAATIQNYHEHPEKGVANYLTFGLGGRIDQGLEDLTKFKKAGHEVVTEFNGIVIDTRDFETPDQIVEYFNQREQEERAAAEARRNAKKTLTPDDFGIGGASYEEPVEVAQPDSAGIDSVDIKKGLKNIAKTEVSEKSGLDRIGNVANSMVQERSTELGINDNQKNNDKQKDDEEKDTDDMIH